MICELVASILLGNLLEVWKNWGIIFKILFLFPALSSQSLSLSLPIHMYVSFLEVVPHFDDAPFIFLKDFID